MITYKVNPEKMNALIRKHSDKLNSWYQDSDGIWVDIKDGYNWCGCGTLHEDTYTRIKSAISAITAGDPY